MLSVEPLYQTDEGPMKYKDVLRARWQFLRPFLIHELYVQPHEHKAIPTHLPYSKVPQLCLTYCIAS